MNTYKAQTFDDGKPPLAVLPVAGIRAVANVQAYGNSKYKSYDDWRKGMEARRITSCAIRHIFAYLDGEDIDPESGQRHIAHAATRLLFLLQNEEDGVLIDDRFKRPEKKA
jgi:hypothetical protein